MPLCLSFRHGSNSASTCVDVHYSLCHSFSFDWVFASTRLTNLLSFIREACFFHCYLQLLTNVSTSSMVHFSLVSVFLVRSFNVLPYINLRTLIPHSLKDQRVRSNILSPQVRNSPNGLLRPTTFSTISTLFLQKRWARVTYRTWTWTGTNLNTRNVSFLLTI